MRNSDSVEGREKLTAGDLARLVRGAGVVFAAAALLVLAVVGAVAGVVYVG